MCLHSLATHDQVRHQRYPQQKPRACRCSLDSTCPCFPPCFPKCVAVAWPSRASSSKTRSTSAPRTTSSSMAPAATAAGTSSQARSSQPWAAPTTLSASCAACAGEEEPAEARTLCPSCRAREGMAFPGQFWGSQGFMLDTWISRISAVKEPDEPVGFKPLAAESTLSNVI